MGWERYLHKDNIAGALLVLTGLGAVYFARPLALGTLMQMGPGYFPTALGIILAYLGVAMVLGGVKRTTTDDRAAPQDAAAPKSDKPDWRGWSCIVGGFVAFIVLFEYAGAVPAATAIVVISAFGERGNGWKSALGLAIFVNIVLVVVFSRALQMPLHLFWWD